MKLRPNLIALAIATAFASGAYAQSVAGNFESKETTTVLTATGVTKAWARGITGKGSTIAILDNGFDLTHADLSSKIVASKNFNSTVAYNNKTNPTAVTWGWHGTLMAGIAAGASNGNGTVGVAPDANLLLGQVGQGGTSTSIEMAALYKGIDWASSLKADVISMSLGSSFDTNFQKQITQMSDGIFKSPAAYGTMYGFKDSDVQAFAVGTNRGSILVAAAGNQGLAYSQYPGAFATKVDSKGALVLGGRMLIVGATDPTGTVMASFSNRAGTICQNVSGTVCNDPYLVKDFYVVAPGMQVYGSQANQMNMGVNGSLPVSGTSPATAYVAGGIALMKQAWPQLRPEQIVNLVLNTATDMGKPGVDEVYGHGLVNFDKATQPMGTLVLANATKLTGSGIQGKALSTTGIVSSGAVQLGTSSVLQNAQAVDGIGRNYTVDLTKAQGGRNNFSYQYGSPWMSFAGTGYRQLAVPIGETSVATLMLSDTGTASKFEWEHSPGTQLSIEVGALRESTAMLGSQGSGAFEFGGSSTQWAGIGFQHAIIGNTSLIGNYSLGVTNTSNKTDSMIKLDSKIYSESWKLGVAQSNIFFKGNAKQAQDTLSLAVAGPVAVRRGYATVSGVTSYNYIDNADGTTDANPVMQSERVSLSPSVRELNLVLGYTVAVRNSSYLGVNLVHQLNAGGVAGQTSTGVSFMARSVF